MQTETNRAAHRLSLRSWENAAGVTGWSLKDLKSGRIIARSHFSDPPGTLNVMRRFLSNERVEALLCSEIDREWSDVLVHSHEEN